MKELIELLKPEEKRRLSYLLLALCVAAFCLWFFSFGQRNRFREARDSLASGRRASAELKISRDRKEAEARRWAEARRDLEEFRTKYFYSGSEGIKEMRMDLQKIFVETGIFVPRLSYEYADLGKEGLQKVVFSFNFHGNYPSIKRFLGIVERFQRIWTIEKIDFAASKVETGALELRVMLAAYYEK
ncbi:MAG TPA: hypothetical protein PLX50_07090 [Candidatus Aminicenantes bacterium]|nr:hypothetical protein [Acidobacteriota bacterium]HOI45358.1 hypothetical protein [Candidatus Aminicenantes bacterium]